MAAALEELEAIKAELAIVEQTLNALVAAAKQDGTVDHEEQKAIDEMTKCLATARQKQQQLVQESAGGGTKKASAEVSAGGSANEAVPGASKEKGGWWEKVKDAAADAVKQDVDPEKRGREHDKEPVVIGAESATLNVQVNFSDGKPASGAPVFCDGKGGKQVSVNDSGSVSVKLPPGTYTVRSLWGASRAQAASPVTLAAGAAKSVVLVLSTGATLQVQVKWAHNGAAVAGATVQVTGSKTASGQTDGTGLAVIPGLEPGSYQVALTAGVEKAEGGTTASVNLTAGELTTISLKPRQAGSGVAGKVESLKTRSQNELALKSQVLEVGYEEADNFADYDNAYKEVAGYLDLANRGHEFSEEQLAWWSESITELAKRRRAIAGRRASGYWQDKKIAAASHIAGLRRSLASQKKSLGNIQKAFQNAENMQEGVSEALALKDNLSTLEDILSFAAERTVLQAIDSAISELSNRVEPTGDAINRHVATLAGYVKKQAAQLEGYESMESLMNQIGGTVSAIRTAVSELDFYVKKYKAAIALEAAPVD
jgi:hypothetical protein